MRDIIGEACESVRAAARGKSKAAIRQMLTAEFRSRDIDLPQPLFDVLVQRIAAGTYDPDEPLVSVRHSGLLRLPIIGKALRRGLGSALEDLSEEGTGCGLVWVSEHLTDAWPMMYRTLPHPPGRDLHALDPDEVPPPARLIPDPDLRERMPDLFEPAPKVPGMPDPAGADLVFAWLEEDGATVAVCCHPGRIGMLDAEDAGAYLPLVQAAHTQDKVVAVTTDIRATAGHLLPATVRAVSHRSDLGDGS